MVLLGAGNDSSTPVTNSSCFRDQPSPVDVPGILPIMKRRFLYGVATVGIALVLGFATGRLSSWASSPVPVSSPAAPAVDPQLPATITLSESKLANLQLQIEEAKAGPQMRAVSATGSVGYDQLHL